MSGGSKPTRSSRSDDTTRRTVRPDGSGGGAVDGADPCDREFDASLTSVDMAITLVLRAGENLSVILRTEGNFESVVCVRQTGNYVGALAGITGLSQLARCLREGRLFSATVTSISGASVFVHVGPIR